MGPAAPERTTCGPQECKTVKTIFQNQLRHLTVYKNRYGVQGTVLTPIRDKAFWHPSLRKVVQVGLDISAQEAITFYGLLQILSSNILPIEVFFF